jgi:predicted MPP superfamily phosphohydrolase
MDTYEPERTSRSAKFHRARIRHFFFTHGPNSLSGGRMVRQHLMQDVLVREVEVVSPHWPQQFDGLRIGHVSDFHLGDLLPLDRALKVVELLASQEPDLVACTGDVVDLHHHEAPPLLRAMAACDAPLGSFLVLGNHDELDDPRAISLMAEREGMIVLRNEAVEINHNGGEMVISGIDWARSGRACARYVDAACGDGGHLLLAHNPKAFQRASEIGMPLTLAGHTHGGQIALKSRPNANLSITHRRSAGLFTRNGSRLYVTTGIGAWFPLRVNCPAEIAMITVRHGRENEAD